MTARRSAAKTVYVVTGALISVRVGDQVLQYSAGDILPNGISDESLKHHLDTGLIEKATEDPESSATDEQ